MSNSCIIYLEQIISIAFFLFQLKIKLTDVNDKPPMFTTHFYAASIEETISVSPPGPIVQFTAQDLDETSQLKYSILSGNTGGTVHDSVAS